MNNPNLFLRLLCIVCFVLSISAQQPVTEAEKARQETEKKALELLEQILTEAQSLKLPENRLRVKAMSAGMLWEKDQPRARTYFQEAENNLKQIIQSLGQEQDNRFDHDIAIRIRQVLRRIDFTGREGHRRAP